MRHTFTVHRDGQCYEVCDLEQRTILCTIYLAFFKIYTFFAHLAAPSNNFIVNDQNRFLGKRKRQTRAFKYAFVESNIRKTDQ